MQLFCDMSPTDIPNFNNYMVDGYGNVYRKNDMSIIKPFKSNKYLQVCIKDDSGVKHVYGVHQVVAMAYLPYYKGCVVHHINENTKNNMLYNLRVEDRSEHSRHHADPSSLTEWLRKNGGPINKGKHPSIESRMKMSESAKRRHSKNK